MNVRFLLIGFLFTCLTTSVTAQEQGAYEQYLEEARGSRQFEKGEWERAKEGLDFSEAAVKKKAPPSVEPPAGDEQGQYEPAPREQNNIRVNPELASGILKFLAILVLAIVLAMVLRGALGLENHPRNKKIRPEDQQSRISLEKIEENIHESDLDAFIRQALEQEEYALALRLYYLSILKELSLRKAISWKKDKTNRQYVQEMRQSAHSAAFEEVTRIFEQTWYGNRPMGKKAYQMLEPKFQKLANRVKAE